MPGIAARSRPFVLRGNVDDVPPSLRHADVSVRGRGAAREPGVDLHRSGTDQDADARGRGGGRGRGRPGPLRGGPGRAGDAGRGGAGPAAQPPTIGHGEQGSAGVSVAESGAGPSDQVRTDFEQLLGWLTGIEAAAMSHGELEEQLDRRGRELLRQMLQGQLDLRALREERATDVTDADGVRHRSVAPGHSRPLTSIFGTVTGLADRHRGHANLYPADAALNLPVERHSHGLRRLAAIEASRGSFEQAKAAIGRATGTSVGKRQVEAVTAQAAGDVAEFYATRPDLPVAPGDVLVITADGKGIVMRPASLRPATAAKARAATRKLATRLSRGEKRNRKRLAEVGAVYDLTPTPRSAADIIGGADTDVARAPAPAAKNTWLTASVVDDAAQVLARGLRRGRAPRPPAPAPMGRPGRRQPSPDRPDQGRIRRPQHPDPDRDRLRARSRVPLGRRLELLRRGRPHRRDVGAPASPNHLGGPGQGRRRTHPPTREHLAPAARRVARQAQEGRRGRPVPSQQRPSTWTTPPPPRAAGRSPPASSKAPAGTWSKIAWTSPAHAGAPQEQKPSYNSEPYELTATSIPTGATT